MSMTYLEIGVVAELFYGEGNWENVSYVQLVKNMRKENEYLFQILRGRAEQICETFESWQEFKKNGTHTWPSGYSYNIKEAFAQQRAA
jgi:hypothetical protein